MPYNVIKNKSGYKVRYKKNGKMHTIPGASKSKAKAKKRIAAIEISKHMHENKLVNEYNITLPSEESVIKKFEDPHSEEAAAILAPYHLTGDDVEMAYEDAIGRLHDNSPVEGNEVGGKLTFSGIEHKGEQRHVKYDIADCNLTLELIFVVGATPEDTEYVETIISNEAAENEGDEENVEESFMFEALFEMVMKRHHHVKLVSNCCGARPSQLTPDVEKPGDVGICSDCEEHAEFEPEEE